MSTWATQRLDALTDQKTKLPPVITTLQLGGLDSWSPGHVKKTWTPTPDLLNGDGTMFGGYISALADQILAFAAMTVVPNDAHFRTSNLAVNFIRLSRANLITIEAKVVSQTRQVITTSAEFHRDDGKLFATATATQFLQPIGG